METTRTTVCSPHAFGRDFLGEIDNAEVQTFLVLLRPSRNPSSRDAAGDLRCSPRPVPHTPQQLWRQCRHVALRIFPAPSAYARSATLYPPGRCLRIDLVALISSLLQHRVAHGLRNARRLFSSTAARPRRGPPTMVANRFSRNPPVHGGMRPAGFQRRQSLPASHSMRQSNWGARLASSRFGLGDQRAATRRAAALRLRNSVSLRL